MNELPPEMRQDRNARLHAAMRRMAWRTIRAAAVKGVYYEKASRFSGHSDYLPLDLWNQTPDE